MKKLIRSTTTRAFLTPKGEWTTNPVEALCVGDNTDLRRLQNDFKLQDIELYYCFTDEAPDQPGYDFSVQLN